MRDFGAIASRDATKLQRHCAVSRLSPLLVKEPSFA